MQIHTILRRAVSGACALALTTVGFVAVPGVANAEPGCTTVVIPTELHDLGALTPGTLLCLDYGLPMEGFNAIGATDTGRPVGQQDVYAGWVAASTTLVWTVPARQEGVNPEIDLETNDAGTFVTTYSWVQPVIQAPGAVTGLTATKTHDNGDVTDLAWSAADQGTYGPLTYVVEGRQSPAGDWAELGRTTGTTLRFAGTHTLAWDFRVHAVDPDGRAGSADTITSSADELVLPDYADFHGFTDVGTDYVVLSWGPDGAGTYPLSGYHVQYRVRGVGEWTDVDSTLDAFTLSGLAPGTEYEFTLVAFDTQGNHGPGSWTTVTTDALPLPVDDEVSAYTQRTWYFDVLANDEGSPTTATVVDGPVAGEVVWDGTRFQYHVTVPGSVEDSFTYRNDVSDAVATVHVTISEPTEWVMGGIQTETTGSTSILVTWNAPDPGSFDLYGYYVYYSDGGPYVHSNRVIGTELVLEGLTPDTEYDIYVMSTDGTNTSSSQHSYATTNAPAAPSVPAHLVAEAVGSDAVDLSWDASLPGDNELDGYDVLYRAVGDEQWLWFDYVYDTVATVDVLEPGTEYEFTVDACDVDEYCSDMSGYARATTDDAPPAPLRPQVSAPGAIVTGATATFEVSDVPDAAIVEAGALGDGVAHVAVDGRTVTVTTVHGFSGTLVQPLLVSDGGDPVEIEATVVVNPDRATLPTYRIASATASRILWTAGAGATGYVVKVGGTPVCTTTAVSCLVPRLLGPANVVSVLATGNDGTVSVTARASWVSVPVNFGHVHFVGDSPTLTAASAVQLRALTAKLLAAGVTRLTVHGYTATLGTATRTPVQLRLSAMRANAVAAYLTAYYTAHGRTLRVVRVADGAARPIASNATYAGRAENRRAEVVLG